jgi:sugar O-acyltransferase (sialic acid O-acetyltransferase NeuD family)
MKHRLLIIGAGGLGRQLEHYLELISDQNKDWELAGYIDDDMKALVNKGSDYKVLGNIQSFPFKVDDYIVIGIADIKSKKKIINTLKNKVRFFTYISEASLIGKNVTIGEGSIVCPGVKIGSNVNIGTFNLINLNCIVGHDSVMGDHCSIMPHVDIGGGARIGKNVFMGTKATVSPLLEVHDDTYLGVGSIVIKNITEPGTYFGNPARRML